MVYGIQNDRTDQTKSPKKEKNQKVVVGPRNIQKTFKNQAVQCILKILGRFSLISRPHYNLFEFFFLGWLCVICAVILNTINLYFMTNFFLGPPLVEEDYVYRKMQKCACSSNILEFFLHDSCSPVWATYLIWVATQNMNFCVLRPALLHI